MLQHKLHYVVTVNTFRNIYLNIHNLLYHRREKLQ